ncbi:hypothetical protein K1719_008930 [Acacia pycnantha]|nr:hypothetical protein K1719_008930 [Acacia pycnantha]
MQSAASLNRKDGLVTPHDVSNVVRKQGLSVSETTEEATRHKLPADKQVTREDAEGVIGAEIRNKPDMKTTPGGVAASVAAAGVINQNK